jgi:hypothetical protein
MLSNSVATNWRVTPVLVVNGSSSQTVTTQVGDGDIGVLSVLVIADVDIHIAKGAGPATIADFLLLANTYFEIPVADLKQFSFIGTGAGNLYMLEWMG